MQIVLHNLLFDVLDLFADFFDLAFHEDYLGGDGYAAGF